MTAPRHQRSIGLQRLMLLCGGVLASGLLAWAALELTQWMLGIRDPEFRYENRLDMWMPDSDVGFVNKPNFDAVAWGTVAVRTDVRGFRKASADRTPGRGPLVVGLGDSVMWGTGVDARDSLLGRLEAQLRDDGPVDVINAGVVGYSSLQELRFLEKFIVPLEPDVVLLNFCNNDLMASQDPFDNVREIHAQYLEEILAEEGERLSPETRKAAQQMLALLRADARAWPQIKAMKPTERAQMMRLLVERPILRMLASLQTVGGQLVLLIIPPRALDNEYAHSASRLTRRVRAAGGGVVDVTRHFAYEPPLRTGKPNPWLSRVPAIESILRYRGIQATHDRRDFVDSVHPSRRGNAVVADRVVSHLRAAKWWRP